MKLRLHPLLALLLLPSLGIADQRSFTLNGSAVTLDEVTAETLVAYQSTRFVRLANAWNIDVCLNNTGTRVLPGPMVVVVESYSATTGPIQPDGYYPSTPPRAYYDLSAQLAGGQLWPGEKTAIRTLTLGYTNGSPELVTRVYARLSALPPGLAQTRSLNEYGQPLPGVNVFENGPLGVSNRVTDSVLGLITLGQGNGAHTWQFSRNGHTPVWRRQTLNAGDAALVPTPRLTPRAAAVPVPLVGAEVSNGTVRVTFAPGAVAQSTLVHLTPLTAQTLPAVLPPGWSPLQAFWLEADHELGAALPATALLWDDLRLGETAVLARWNSGAFQWDNLQLLSGQGTNRAIFNVPGSGAFVVAIQDTGAGAPALPQIGQPLAPGTIPLPSYTTLTAGGPVSPGVSLPSRVREQVTATANVAISNQSGALPSGVWLRCDVTEDYRLRDGSRRRSPVYEHFITGYRRPAPRVNGQAAPDGILQAIFPMQPLQLFGADALDLATVTVDVLPPGTLTGRQLDAAGGQVTVGGVTLLAAPGDLDGRQMIQVRKVDATNFIEVAGYPIVCAFDLSLAGVAAGRHLTLQVPFLPPNSQFVLARVIARDGWSGWEPVERLASGATGILGTAEPASGERLPGITGAGQYLLLKIGSPLGLVTGIARDTSGQPAGGLPVTMAGQPWLTFSANNGFYRLLAPAGTTQVGVTDPATGDTTFADVTISNPQIGATVNITATLHGPRVVATTPANGASNVPRVTTITVEFSEPINPVILAQNGVRLVNATGGVVSASATINLRNTIITLLPAAELTAGTNYTIRLSPDIADLGGTRLEGPTAFTFTTARDVARPEAAQVTSYEPVNGIAAMSGSPGTAEAESPVILVNETTGATATILSKPDGSFSNSIPAAVDDTLSAVVVNGNGTRNTIGVSRQIFRDGSVGLFRSGGVVEAGGSQIILEPGTIQTKTIFKLDAVTSTQVLASIAAPVPTNTTLAAAVQLRVSGDLTSGEANVVLPFDPVAMQVAEPERGAYVLTLVRRNAVGDVAFQVVDKLRYEDGKLKSNTFPFLGFLAGIMARSGTGTPDSPYDSAADWYLAAMLVGTEGVPVTGTVTGFVGLKQVPGTDQQVPNYRPLGGALVMLRTPDLVLPAPGRLPRGVQYAITDAAGHYSLLVPKGGSSGYLLTATHLNFADIQAEPLGYIATADALAPQRVDFQLNETLVGLPPIRYAITVSPAAPPFGSTATLQVVASQDSQAPAVNAVVQSVSPAVPNASVSTADVEVSNQRVMTDGNTTTFSLDLKPTNAIRTVTVALQMTAGQGVQPILVSHVIRFGPRPESIPESIALTDSNDVAGPRVVSAIPAQGGVLPHGEPVRIQFNEPISRAILDSPGAISVSGPGSPHASLRLSPDQQELSVGLAGLTPGATFQLSVNSAVVDLNGNAFDQNPGEPGRQSYSYSFRAPEVPKASFPGIVDGGGVVLGESTAYVLERAPGKQALVLFDLRSPLNPSELGRFALPATPRDLCLIPHYDYWPAQDGPPGHDQTLVAVVGGDVSTTTVTADNGVEGDYFGQYLRVINVTAPAQPTRVVGTPLSRRNGLVSKVRWSAPFLTCLESGSDYAEVGLIDLAAMIVGFGSTAAQAQAFPAGGRPGVDQNGDGDYGDAGETPPLPVAQPLEFFGKHRGYLVTGTSQHVLDYDLAGGSTQNGLFLGITLTGGQKIDAQGHPLGPLLAPAYRTLAYGLLGQLPTPLPEDAGYAFFGAAARPKRVTLLTRIPYGDGTQNTIKDLALVSLSPDNDGNPALAIVDISDFQHPVLLNTIPMTEAAGGGYVQNVTVDADGLLRVATTRDVVLLDPTRLAAPASAGGQAHPAMIGVLPGNGSGNISLGANDAGLAAVSLGSRNEIVQNAPRIRFLVAPDFAVSNPFGEHFLDQTNLDLFFSQAEPQNSLPAARFRSGGGAVSSLTPPAALVHYYVLVEAPGGYADSENDRELYIGLESLDRAGRPHRNKGRLFPPVRALSDLALGWMDQRPRRDCDAPIPALRARRLSNDPRSPHYNQFLSQPFALITESASVSELNSLTNAAGGRLVLWGGFYLRACLDPASKLSTVQSFLPSPPDAGTKRLALPAWSMAETLPGTYIMGQNPLPPNSQIEVPGTFGTVSAQNGQFMNDTVDLALPGRRLPIVFQRSIRSQDLHDGPFGRGWDHVYNQQVTYLRPDLFPPGQVMPLILRHLIADSTRAESGDVILQTGQGRNLLFKNKGPAAPPGIDQDPVVLSEGWSAKAQSFFLPDPTEHGVFDIMIRFHSGQFVRLTPDGMQYWYSRQGRLEKIYHRHKLNWQELVYNELGELTRITDKSYTSTERYVELGYYRYQGDPAIRTGLDEVTAESFVIGRVCRIRDHTWQRFTETDVIYHYTADGLLQERLGPKAGDVEGDVEGVEEKVVSFIDRPKTTYIQTGDCGVTGFGITAGNSADGKGTPLFAGSVDGDGAITQGTGAGGPVSFTPPSNNRASSADPLLSIARGPDGPTRFDFDPFGHPRTLTLSGNLPGSSSAKYELEHQNGLLARRTDPLTNSVVYTYATNDLVFRSRGNLLREEHFPGPAGASQASLVASHHYDNRYNLPAGNQMDFNGKTIVYTLTEDGTEVGTISYEGAGQAAAFTYNPFGQTLTVTTPDGQVTETRYFTSGYTEGFRREEIRGVGAAVPMTITFAYSESRRAGLLGVPTTITLPRGASTIQSFYDNRIQLRKVTRDTSKETREYDENGNVVHLKRTLGDGKSYEEIRHFNQINFLTDVTVKQVETGNATADLVTRFTPDAAWRVAVTELPGGEFRTNTYNHLGHLERVDTTKPGGALVFEAYRRDVHGNVLELRRGTQQPGSEPTGVLVQSFLYDGFDRLIATTNFLSAAPDPVRYEVTTYDYAPGGQQIRMTVKNADGTIAQETRVDNPAANIDGLGRVTRTFRVGSTFDAITTQTFTEDGGRTITASGPRAGYAASSTRDTAGRVQRTVSPILNPIADVSFKFDGNGNTTNATSIESGGLGPFMASKGYDAFDHVNAQADDVGTLATFVNRLDGRPTKVTDARNKETTQTYSVLGETLQVDRPESIQFKHRYDKNRQGEFEGDRENLGHGMEYSDGTLRMTVKTLCATEAKIEYKEPNALNLPQRIEIPGGVMTRAYDLKGRPTEEVTTYGSGPGPGARYEVTGTSYDALDRITSTKFGSASQYQVDYGYDKLGPMLTSTSRLALGTFTIASSIYEDGSRSALQYPSGAGIHEERDVSGRLQKVNLDQTEICQVSYAAADIPGEIRMGPNSGVLRQVNQYDLRKRLLGRQYIRASDGAVLVDLRYAYDGANNVRVRQQVHRHGRADIFGYDDASRLVSSHMGARPDVPNAMRYLSTGLTEEFGLKPGFYARNTIYDSRGLDLLSATVDTNPEGFTLPLFAHSWDAFDGYLHAGQLDGTPRARDALGNTTHTLLAVRPAGGGTGPLLLHATNTYNGLSQLVRIDLENGTTIDYEYRPDGLMHHRVVRENGVITSDTGFIYSGGLLLEEYARSGGVVSLKIRYYYNDADVPFAADFFNGGPAERVYFLKDALGSIVALADAAGQVVERVNYDAWGQPEIQGRDTAAPVVSAILASTNGNLLIQFSEPVLPPPVNPGIPGAAPALVTQTLAFGAETAGRIELLGPGGPVALDPPAFEEDLDHLSGMPFGVLVRLKPSVQAPVNLVLHVAAGAVRDEWGNPNPEINIPIVYDGRPNGYYYGPAVASTAPPLLARSAIGSSLLFHGQWYDYDAGLSYMRARFYDPFSGQFLQRDPMEYKDSVNLYAALAQNPTSRRDPKGTAVLDWALQKAEEFEAQEEHAARWSADNGSSVAAFVHKANAIAWSVVKHAIPTEEDVVTGRSLPPLVSLAGVAGSRALSVGAKGLTKLNGLAGRFASLAGRIADRVVPTARRSFAIRTDEGTRLITVVSTSRGPQAFYRSTGKNSGMPGRWLPFDGIDKKLGYVGDFGRFERGFFQSEGPLMFNKGAFATGRASYDPLRRFGDPRWIPESFSKELLAISKRLASSKKSNDVVNYDVLTGVTEEEFEAAAQKVNRDLFERGARSHSEFWFYLFDAIPRAE